LHAYFVKFRQGTATERIWIENIHIPHAYRRNVSSINTPLCYTHVERKFSTKLNGCTKYEIVMF
jgi:hypothetical protein